MQNTQLDKRANFHFTVRTPLKSIKFLPHRDFLASNFKVKIIRTYESVSPQKRNLPLTVKFTEIEQINLTTSKHQKGTFLPSIPHSQFMPALAHSRLLSVLAEFMNLAKSTCFSAGPMSSTGSVHQSWPERKHHQAARTRGARNKTSPFFQSSCVHIVIKDTVPLSSSPHPSLVLPLAHVSNQMTN